MNIDFTGLLQLIIGGVQIVFDIWRVISLKFKIGSLDLSFSIMDFLVAFFILDFLILNFWGGEED